MSERRTTPIVRARIDRLVELARARGYRIRRASELVDIPNTTRRGPRAHAVDGTGPATTQQPTTPPAASVQVPAGAS